MRPAIPFRSNDATNRKTMTAATFRALRRSQSRDACRARSARSGATKSITIAIANGNNDTNEKKTQSTMYCVVLGLVSEMSLSASGINPPGFASAAPMCG